MARVVTADGLGRGSLNIAGAVIDASLPKDVQAGQELRLTVRHVSPDRVELSLSDQTRPTAAARRGRPASRRRDRAGDRARRRRWRPRVRRPHADADRHTLSLRYDAPALGAVDLRFELDPESLRVSATLAAGAPFDLALDGAGELGDALTEAIGRPVTVDVSPRREPLDVYA